MPAYCTKTSSACAALGAKRKKSHSRTRIRSRTLPPAANYPQCAHLLCASLRIETLLQTCCSAKSREFTIRHVSTSRATSPHPCALPAPLPCRPPRRSVRLCARLHHLPVLLPRQDRRELVAPEGEVERAMGRRRREWDRKMYAGVCLRSRVVG